MLKKLIFCAVAVVPVTADAQISFEKGYYIDLDGNKVECLIKNMDWKNNPNRFEYKLSEDGESKTMGISAIQEFGINNFSKYVKEAVKIDRSSEEFDSLSSQSSPIWSAEQLLLKVLVEGKASLYVYRNGNLIRFFYKVNGSGVQQLIYKKYLASNGSIGTNSFFHQQLLMDVKCAQATSNSVRNISYSNSLVLYFNKYNECNGERPVNFFSKARGGFNFKIKPGVDFASFRLAASAGPKHYDLGSKTNFRIGLEAEYVLPSNKNKWSILIDPAFQHYSGATGSGSVNYKSIEIPIGLRHYFFLGDKAKLYLNILLGADNSFNSEVNGISFHAEQTVITAFGAGFGYGSFNVEFRDYLSRSAIGTYGSRYQKTSFLLGYKLF